MRLWAAILLLAMLLGPRLASGSPTPGELCTLTGTGSLSGDVESFRWTGAIHGCADLGGDDDVLVDGATVTVDGDLTFDSNVGGEHVGLRVRNGGSIAFRADADTGRVDVAIGAGYAGGSVGVDVESTAASVSSTGTYREFGVPRPGTVAAPTSGRTVWPAGVVLPCPGWDAAPTDGGAAGTEQWESDCAGALAVDPEDQPGSRARMGLVYPHDAYAGESSSERFVLESLAELNAGEVLCWYDPDPSTPQAPVQDGFCYEITEATPDKGGAGKAGAILFDVQQSDPQDPQETSYPLSRRRIEEGALDTTLDAGSRSVRTSAEGALSRDDDLVGRWLRFGDGSGEPDPTKPPMLISGTSDRAGGDDFELADQRGAPEPLAPGTKVWIDYGMTRGEPFLVYVPVVFTSANDNPNPVDYRENEIEIGANVDASFRATVFDDLRQIGIEDDHEDFLCTDCWLRDFGSANNNGFKLSGWRGAEITRFSVTGGFDDDGNPESPDIDCTGLGYPGDSCDRNHPFVPGAGDDGHDEEPGTLTVRTLAIRHAGDDNWAHVAVNATVDLRRMRTEFVADEGRDSSVVIGTAGGGFLTGSWEQIATFDGSGGAAGTGPRGLFRMKREPSAPGTPGPISLDGLLAVGNDTNGGGLVVGAQQITGYATNVMAVGVEGGVGGNQDLARFVIRDSTSDSTFFGAYDSSSQAGRFDARDGVIRNVRIREDAPLVPNVEDDWGVVENVLFHNVTAPPGASAPMIRSFGNDVPHGVSIVLRNLTFVWDPGTDAAWRHLYVLKNQEGDADRVTLEGHLVSNWDDNATPGNALGFTSSSFADFFANTTAGPCLFRSQTVSHNGRPERYPGSTVRGRDPNFVDPASGRYDTPSGGYAASQGATGCGIRRGSEAPGITEFQWIHAISRLRPEGQADACADGGDGDGDGLVDYGEDPGCAAEADASERGPEFVCDDGIDNDGDGLADYGADPGCLHPTLPWEASACDDGVDNDGDGRIDFADSTCTATGAVESRRVSCGLGFELAVVLVLLGAGKRLAAGSCSARRRGGASPVPLLSARRSARSASSAKAFRTCAR